MKQLAQALCVMGFVMAMCPAAQASLLIYGGTQYVGVSSSETIYIYVHGDGEEVENSNIYLTMGDATISNPEILSVDYLASGALFSTNWTDLFSVLENDGRSCFTCLMTDAGSISVDGDYLLAVVTIDTSMANVGDTFTLYLSYDDMPSDFGLVPCDIEDITIVVTGSNSTVPEPSSFLIALGLAVSGGGCRFWKRKTA